MNDKGKQTRPTPLFYGCLKGQDRFTKLAQGKLAPKILAAFSPLLCAASLRRFSAPLLCAASLRHWGALQRQPPGSVPP